MLIMWPRRPIWLNYFKREWRWLLLVAVVGSSYLTLALPTVWYGPYNPDEGIYLYAAWQWSDGQLPYRDGAFHQPPLSLVPHALAQGLLGPSFYLGRVTSALLGLLVVVITMLVTRRLAGVAAALVAGVSLAFLPWFVINMVSVSVYPLAALFLLGLIWTAATGRWLWLGVFTVAVIWTKLSFAPLLPVIGVWALFQPRPLYTVRRWLAGSLLAALIVVVPFWLFFPEDTFESVIYHNYFVRQNAARSLGTLAAIPPWLRTIVAFWHSDYWPLFRASWVAALIGVMGISRTSGRWRGRPLSPVWLAGSLVIVSALVHAPAINVTYDVPLFPLLAILAGVGMAELIPRLAAPRRQPLVTSLLVCLIALATWWPQRVLLDHPDDPEESHHSLDRVVSYIAHHTQPTDRIFTPELYVAVASQRQVVANTGLGRFFFFPELTAAHAERMHVLTTDAFWQMIASREAKVIVVHQRHWWRHIGVLAESPAAVMQRIEAAGYRRVESLRDYHPAVEGLQVYERL